MGDAGGDEQGARGEDGGAGHRHCVSGRARSRRSGVSTIVVGPADALPRPLRIDRPHAPLSHFPFRSTALARGARRGRRPLARRDRVWLGFRFRCRLRAGVHRNRRDGAVIVRGRDDGRPDHTCPDDGRTDHYRGTLARVQRIVGGGGRRGGRRRLRHGRGRQRRIRRVVPVLEFDDRRQRGGAHRVDRHLPRRSARRPADRPSTRRARDDVHGGDGRPDGRTRRRSAVSPGSS